MVEMFGLSRPVPTMMRNSPRKKVACAGIARQMCPNMMIDAAEEHRPALAQQAVGHPAAGERPRGRRSAAYIP